MLIVLNRSESVGCIFPFDVQDLHTPLVILLLWPIQADDLLIVYGSVSGQRVQHVIILSQGHGEIGQLDDGSVSVHLENTFNHLFVLSKDLKLFFGFVLVEPGSELLENSKLFLQRHTSEILDSNQLRLKLIEVTIVYRDADLINRLTFLIASSISQDH